MGVSLMVVAWNLSEAFWADTFPPENLRLTKAPGSEGRECSEPRSLDFAMEVPTSFDSR